jgi:hypothetical protein
MLCPVLCGYYKECATCVWKDVAKEYLPEGAEWMIPIVDYYLIDKEIFIRSLPKLSVKEYSGLSILLEFLSPEDQVGEYARQRKEESSEGS